MTGGSSGTTKFALELPRGHLRPALAGGLTTNLEQLCNHARNVELLADEVIHREKMKPLP